MNFQEIQKFCSKDPTRMTLSQPFQIDEWVYATDGYLAIRIPASSILDQIAQIDNESYIKTLRDFFSSDPVLKSILAFPEKPEEKECALCQGEGIDTYGHCGHQAECTSCDGSGQALDDYQVDVGGILFSADVFSRIRGLPNIAIEVNPSHPLKPHRFRFDGGEGVIMPMRKSQRLRTVPFDLFALPELPKKGG